MIGDIGVIFLIFFHMCDTHVQRHQNFQRINDKNYFSRHLKISKTASSEVFSFTTSRKFRKILSNDRFELN
ncbi:MAG: hypothetical protein Ta2E_12700 [Mycoplasmoidaceae bacterium]|nr:MAG: hypothetical protein Ta2E_12700 [Mycoplasmoidaceae bacterium]